MLIVSLYSHADAGAVCEAELPDCTLANAGLRPVQDELRLVYSAARRLVTEVRQNGHVVTQAAVRCLPIVQVAFKDMVGNYPADLAMNGQSAKGPVDHA